MGQAINCVIPQLTALDEMRNWFSVQYKCEIVCPNTLDGFELMWLADKDKCHCVLQLK